jgi:hypothetical protein
LLWPTSSEREPKALSLEPPTSASSVIAQAVE